MYFASAEFYNCLLFVLFSYLAKIQKEVRLCVLFFDNLPILNRFFLVNTPILIWIFLFNGRRKLLFYNYSLPLRLFSFVCCWRYFQAFTHVFQANVSIMSSECLYESVREQTRFISCLVLHKKFTMHRYLRYLVPLDFRVWTVNNNRGYCLVLRIYKGISKRRITKI